MLITGHTHHQDFWPQWGKNPLGGTAVIISGGGGGITCGDLGMRSRHHLYQRCTQSHIDICFCMYMSRCMSASAIISLHGYVMPYKMYISLDTRFVFV